MLFRGFLLFIITLNVKLSVISYFITPIHTLKYKHYTYTELNQNFIINAKKNCSFYDFITESFVHRFFCGSIISFSCAIEISFELIEFNNNKCFNLADKRFAKSLCSELICNFFT